ncbi:hypothetical protein ASZ78_009363 [Callipepla squamata]|uniref:Kazal-like domain-containing protein n=1 Tax=Callipepla squamata TaxID=9009 RepID=A0A226ME13_CALSU|nr:hypothetical protein ASZ78_009363 [Callipepla squamata]
MVGIVVGGAILKRFQMSLRQCSAMCILGMLICLILALPLVFLGCPTQKVASVTYSESSEIGLHVSECSLHCNCPEKAYNPICGSDGIEYISPCYAGCRVVSIANNSVLNYTNCSCISENGLVGSAKPGTCGTGCSHLLLPFVVLSCLAGILASTSHTPSFMLILRSIQPEDKSFAVGIQFMLLRVLAWMPGPVLYGSAIDTTCILWEKKYLGLQFFFEVGAFLCFVMVYVILKRQEKDASDVAEAAADPEKKNLAENSKKSPESKV